jgi:hypothetical protein
MSVYLAINFIYNSSNVGTRAAVSNSSRLKEVSCRTESYYKSFFPSSIRQWNALSYIWSDNPSVSHFKFKLFELWRVKSNEKPKPSDYIKVSKGGVGRLLSQFRMGLSPLHFHLFSFNINDNPFCPSCFESFETTKHFFIECQSYSRVRDILMQDIFEICVRSGVFDNINIISAEQIYSWIIYGFPLSNANSNVSINSSIFKAVCKYVISTKRFSSDVYYCD